MPGRHGAPSFKRNKSRRQRPDQMETTLKDSIHNSRRREQSILKDLVPPRLQALKRGFVSAPKPTPPAPLDGPRDAAEAADAGLSASTNISAGDVLTRLAALRAANAAAALKDTAASKVIGVPRSRDWAAQRDVPAPELKLDARRERILQRRRAVAEQNAAKRADALARKAARRAAAAEGNDEDDEGEDAAAEPEGAATTAAALVEAMPRAGKKAASKQAFKVLKAKIAEKKLQRQEERKNKAAADLAKREKKIQSKAASANGKKGGKGKKAAGGSKAGKKGKKSSAGKKKRA